MDKIFPPKDVPAIAIPLTVDGSGDADRKAPSVVACSCPICTRKSDSSVSNRAPLPCPACRGPRVLTRTESTAPATTASMPRRTRSFTVTRRSATRMSPGRSLQRLPSTMVIGAPSPTSRSSISRCRHSLLPQWLVRIPHRPMHLPPSRREPQACRTPPSRSPCQVPVPLLRGYSTTLCPPGPVCLYLLHLRHSSPRALLHYHRLHPPRPPRHPTTCQ